MNTSAQSTGTGSSRFTEHLWDAARLVREGIDDLDFLRQLGDGTLPLDVFRTYIEQDLLYLDRYAKALSIVAAHAPTAEATGFWAGAATQTATVEAALHKDLLSSGVLPDATGDPVPSPACLAYTSYLTATAATEPYAVAAAAALPCFWIYADVGTRLAATAHDVLAADPSHPYARWVTTYDAPEFHEEVANARRFVDAAADDATPAVRSAMTEAFVVAARYELMFWDAPLNPQNWPAS
ncbi:MAG: TenA family transcriptional regulator [Rhodococcus sp.]|nr:TenA family transcriptional regulator [Rhodococcus sp. (in: high G+C Gram-positive bacteria)]